MPKTKKNKMYSNENKFFTGIKDNPNDEGPLNSEIADWLKEFPEVDSLASLAKVMLKDGFFENKHYVFVLETGEYYGTHIAK